MSDDKFMSRVMTIYWTSWIVAGMIGLTAAFAQSRTIIERVLDVQPGTTVTIAVPGQQPTTLSIEPGRWRVRLERTQ